jgi:uncharacterized protein YkwD
MALPDVTVPADAGAEALSFQEYNLQLINMYRATQGIAPLVLNPTMSSFALAGSQELSMDHLPHQHFMNAGNMIWMDGFTPPQAGENQGDPNGWRVLSTDPTMNEMMQIQQILAAMFAEGPPGDAGDHGHYQNIMNPAFKHLGVGLVEVNGHLYLTNDFSS